MNREHKERAQEGNDTTQRYFCNKISIRSLKFPNRSAIRDGMNSFENFDLSFTLFHSLNNFWITHLFSDICFSVKLLFQMNLTINWNIDYIMAYNCNGITTTESTGLVKWSHHWWPHLLLCRRWRTERWLRIIVWIQCTQICIVC